MKKPVQLYVLGDGEEEYRNMFLSYQEQYPDKVYVQLDYTDEMAKIHLCWLRCDINAITL